jgi:hypothetical protein
MHSQTTKPTPSAETACSIDPAAGSGAFLVDYLITGDNQKAIAILEAKIAEKKRHIGAYYTPQAVKDHMEQIQSNDKIHP